MRDYTYKHGTYDLPNDLRPKNLRPKKKKKTLLVSGNGGDEQNLHSGGHKKKISI